MGFDMYLNATKYLSKFSNPDKAEEVRKLFPEMFKIDKIKFEAGYWRKANHIHKWFVDNVQYEEDDCREYSFSREELLKLKEICLKAVESFNNKEIEKLKEDLPVQSGFFFGGTEYNEDYLNDCKETIKIIDRCLTLPDDWGFEYNSSW